jgi:uncharacterized protein YgiM (DUF1202 family)
MLYNGARGKIVGRSARVHFAMRRIKWFIGIVGVLLMAAAAAVVIAQTDITAEAVGQANLRAAPSVEAELVGQITSGTRYLVIGRDEFFPWLLLADSGTRQPIGWVFQDLVNVQGSAPASPSSWMTSRATQATPLGAVAYCTCTHGNWLCVAMTVRRSPAWPTPTRGKSTPGP